MSYTKPATGLKATHLSQDLDLVTSSISSSVILRYTCKIHRSCVKMPYGRCMYPDDYDSHVVSGIPHRGYRPSGYQHREMDDYRHGSRNPMYRTGRPHMPPSSCSYPHDCPPFRENQYGPFTILLSRNAKASAPVLEDVTRVVVTPPNTCPVTTLQTTTVWACRPCTSVEATIQNTT